MNVLSGVPVRRAIVAVWVLAVVLAVWVVKFTRIGPVVAVISEQHGWGVHSGDFLAIVPFVIAVVFTVLWGRRKVEKS